jgi:predicted ATPase
MPALDLITLKGFKSIKELDKFYLSKMNMLIGSNGAGKTNLIAFFKLLNQLVDGRLQHHVTKQGGASAFLHNGPKVTKQIFAELLFGNNGYRVSLEPDVDGNLFIAREEMHFKGVFYHHPTDVALGSGHRESKLPKAEEVREGSIASYVVPTLQNYRVYHFHDTSETAGIKLPGQINDHRFLRPDASNLAAFLRVLKLTQPVRYARIRETIQLAAPFFDDFLLEPIPENPEMIRLEWRQKGLDYPFLTHHLSDGTLRFMALTALLLQPVPPSMIILDEPELGLHPVAIELLAALLHETALRSQVLASTQSPVLINHFEPEEVIVVDRVDGASNFRRLEKEPLRGWLEDYSLGELIQKNVIEAGPRHD